MVDLRPPATVLQFSATLVSRKPEDQIREFVVAFHLDDLAFSVSESYVPNSGFRAGQFLKKTVVNNPKTGKPYDPHDIYVGATISLGGWQFMLQEASEDALKVMEAHSDVFTKCDLSRLIEVIKSRMKLSPPELLVQFQKKDPRKRGYLPLLEVQSILQCNGLDFGDQEFLTLFRRYQIRDTDNFEYQDFVKSIAS